MDDLVTDTYLPPEHLGAVEARLLQDGGSLVGPIYSADEINTSLPLRLCASPIDASIRFLTARYPDGPTYFAITNANAVNAMIARFEGFQCIVVAQGVHIRASVLLASLLAHEPLRAFLDGGQAPAEPTSEPLRSREEALVHLIEEQAFPIDDEVRSLTASLTFFLLYVLTAHELGHLALGHLHARSSGKMEEEGPGEESPAESRALEWDADGFALAGALYLTGSEFRTRPGWRDLLKDEEAGFRLVSVVAYVLFTLMDSMGPQDRPREERTHPRPLVRMGLATLTLMMLMEQSGSVSGQQMLEQSRAAIRAVEITLHELGGGVMEPALAQHLGDELDKEVQQLASVLDELWPKLDRSRLDGLYWARGLKARRT